MPKGVYQRKEETSNADQEIKMFNYKSALDELVKNKTKELEDINHQKLLALNQLKAAQDGVIRERSIFEQYKREEELKFRNVLNAKEADVNKRLSGINVKEQQLSRREADLKEKEKVAFNVADDRLRLNTDRLELERMKIQVRDSLINANKMNSDNLNKANMLTARELQAKASIEKCDAFNKDLVNREADLNKRIEQFRLEERHLEALKKFVDPKVKEITDREAVIKSQLFDIEKKTKDVEVRRDENRKFLAALEDREKKAASEEKRLLTLSEEVQRKALAVGIK